MRGGADNATGCVIQNELFSQWTLTDTNDGAGSFSSLNLTDGTLPGGPVDLNFSFSSTGTFIPAGFDPQVTFTYTVTVLDPNSAIEAAGATLNGLLFGQAFGDTSTGFLSSEWCVNGDCSDPNSRFSSLLLPNGSSSVGSQVGFSPNITSAFVGMTLAFNSGKDDILLNSIDMTYTQVSTTPEPATMLLVGSVLAALGLIRVHSCSRRSTTGSGHQGRERPRRRYKPRLTWRLECGRPPSELCHPAIDSGEMGSPIPSKTTYFEWVRSTSAALSLVLLITTASFASGSPLLTTTNAVDGLDGGIFTPYCIQSAGCNGTATVIPPSGSFGGTFLNYATSETAGFGVFTLSATGTLSVPQPAAITSSVVDVFAGAAAIYEDQWTVLGGTTGDVGSLLLTFTVSESSTATSSALTRVFFDGENTTTAQDFPVVPANQPGIYVVTIPIILGQQFDYELGMQASATLDGIATGGFNSESATVDVNAVLTGITVLDQGTPVPFTFTTASGSPNFNVSTPEPGSMLLLATGMLSLAAKRRLWRLPCLRRAPNAGKCHSEGVASAATKLAGLPALCRNEPTARCGRCRCRRL
jgi:hypothetical protein